MKKQVTENKYFIYDHPRRKSLIYYIKKIITPQLSNQVQH